MVEELAEVGEPGSDARIVLGVGVGVQLGLGQVGDLLLGGFAEPWQVGEGADERVLDIGLGERRRGQPSRALEWRLRASLNLIVTPFRFRFSRPNVG